MTLDQQVQRETGTERPLEDPAQLDALLTRALTAEGLVTNLRRALDTNRRIGMALGILMWQRRIPDDDALLLLRTHSQHHNVKMRELAETVILTGTF